jgi:zinc protease
METGSEVNAFTGMDWTTYELEIPVEIDEGGRKRIPAPILMIADDWTHAVDFQQQVVDEERLVILEEYQVRAQQEKVLWKVLTDVYQGSRYARRLPLGIPDVIETTPPSRMENLYKTWYRTDNMVLVFVGDFDGAALEADLATCFTAPSPASPREVSQYELPVSQGRAMKNLRSVVFTDPDIPSALVYLYHRRSPKAASGDLAAFREDLVDNLVSAALEARFEDLRSPPESPVEKLGFWHERLGRVSRLFAMEAVSKPGQTEAALETLVRERESVLRYGFTAGELARAKEKLLAALERDAGQDLIHSRVYAGKLTSHFLQGTRASSPEWELRAASALLPGIDGKDLHDALKDYLGSGDLFAYVVIPEAEDALLDSWDQFHSLIQNAPRFEIPRPRE